MSKRMLLRLLRWADVAGYFLHFVFAIWTRLSTWFQGKHDGR